MQKARACTTDTERVSLGNPFWERCGYRTRKVQEDLLGVLHQACDVRRYPVRALDRDRQVAQQGQAEHRVHTAGHFPPVQGTATRLKIGPGTGAGLENVRAQR